MSIGEIIIVVMAAAAAYLIITNALGWAPAGIGGVLKITCAAVLAVGGISLVVLFIGVNLLYPFLKGWFPGTEAAQDAEGLVNTVIDIWGEAPQAGWLTAPEGEQPFEAPPWGAPEGVQPTPVPGAPPTYVTPTPVIGAVAPQVAPQAIAPQPGARLIEDPEERAACWREEALKKGLQTATSGGASWFPAGTTCSMEWGLGTLWRADRFWVTCLDLGLIKFELNKGLGGQLAKLAGQSGGTFYGTASSWPPACYLEVAVPTPTPAPVIQTPTPTPTAEDFRGWVTLEVFPKSQAGNFETCQPVTMRVFGSTLAGAPVALYRDSVWVMEVTADGQGAWEYNAQNLWGLYQAALPSGARSQVWDHHQTCPTP